MIDVQAILRLASTVACGIVLAAFAMWATDEAKAGSDQQVAAVAEGGGTVIPPDYSAEQKAPPAAEHGGVRGRIEQVNEALVSPFDHVGADSGVWPAHALPALLALLTYGLLGRILIAYLPR